MGSDDRTLRPSILLGDPPVPSGPLVLHPEWQQRGTEPATRMLNRDLVLQPKFSHQQSPTGPHFQPPTAATIPMLSQRVMNETDIEDLRAYIAANTVNLMVPGPAPSAPDQEGEASHKEDKPFWDVSATGPSRGSTEGGVSIEDRRGVREYISSGYTRRNPDAVSQPDGTRSTVIIDDDFSGKWEDHAEIVGAKAEHEFFDVSVAEESFGESESVFSGELDAFRATSKASSQFSITQEGTSGVSPGMRASAGAMTDGAALRGRIGTGEALADTSQTPITGQATGSALSGKAEGKAELILTPEQATLGGKLGADVNLIEGKLEGDLHITPRRIVNPGINMWNWAFDDDIGELSENWDIGITVGGEVSGQVGAQAGAEARAGYENGRARAEAGVKLGLGLGAGVKGRVGFMGLDKAWNGVKSGISSAWNAIWDD